MSSTAATSEFLFAVSQRGAEQALKREIDRHAPQLRLAFSRPGFLTFKANTPTDLQSALATPYVFARTHGISLGKVTGDQLLTMADALWKLPDVVASLEQKPLHGLHVFQRDPPRRGSAEANHVVTPLAAEIERGIRERAPSHVQLGLQSTTQHIAPAGRNQQLLDVIVVEPGEWWIGRHRVKLPQHRWPGGMQPLQMPAHAVSRAYLKMQEALDWSGLPVSQGDRSVEIGCAPGGSSQALLDRGLWVTGIDPAEVDEILAEHPRFRHIRKRGDDVRRSEFRRVRWLAADLNVTPQYTLDTVEAVVTHPKVAIRGMILTLKLANWELADALPDYLQRIRGWGYRDVRARQLAMAGREICIVALRSRALRRIGRRSPRPAQADRHDQHMRSDDPHESPLKPHFS